MPLKQNLNKSINCSYDKNINISLSPQSLYETESVAVESVNKKVFKKKIIG
jgi:hypothetical protein